MRPVTHCVVSGLVPGSVVWVRWASELTQPKLNLMNKNLNNRSSLLLHALLLIALIAMTSASRASIVGPYTADANTLHLWHLDETATPCVDSASSGAASLLGLATGATLSNASFSGPFNFALNTAAGGAAKGDLLSVSASAANVTITLADATSGAFTFEAVVQVGFDPTATSTAAYEILSGESGTTANRIFQWRIAPKGFTLITGTVAAQPYLTFENIRGGTAAQGTIYAAIPTNGPDAIVSNGWYHVAVTYNGIPNTPNNIKLYWTLMDPSRISANLLTISSAVSQCTGLNPLATVTTPFMLGNQARSKNGNFLGSIDEVRISKIERTAALMMFAPSSATVVTEPPTNTLVAAGDNLNLTVGAGGGGTLGYQWFFNGASLSAAQNPTATNATLVLTNIGTNQAGGYYLIVSNAGSSATSTVANVQVGQVASTLFNTGVDDSGHILFGGTIDPHWQLVQSDDPAFPGPNAFAVTSPVAAWLPNGPNSDWIAPADGPNIAGGNFTYQTTFLLDTFDPANTQITGGWASDNQGQNIILNGVSLGITNSTSLSSLSSFTITNGFVPGFNTIQCVISNNPGGGNNPSGVRIELRAVGLPLPPTAPQIVSAPTNITTETGQTAKFSVAVVGSGPLSYQWYQGSTLLIGQTNRNLVLANLATNQSGTYSVTVSNSLNTANASATLTVIAAPVVAWLGTNGANWDTNTINWLDTNSLADVAFAAGDNVIFDDRGIASSTVDLIGPISPNALLVNSSGTYLFNSDSSGSLTGSFNLTKDGTGTLILDTVNTYTGSTVISNGILQVGNNDANGSLGSGSVTNNGTLAFARFDTFFVPNSISGTGTVEMIGTGQAVLAGNSSYTGPTVVMTGQVNARSSTALGSGNSGTTVMDGAQLYIDFGINITNEPLAIGGTGINSDGALRKGGSTSTVLGGPITLLDFAGIQVDNASVLTLTNAASITSTNQNLALQCLGNGQLIINGAVNLGTGALQELGNGTVVLAGTNNVWTGGTTLSGGTLQIGDGGNDGSVGDGQIDDESILSFASSGNISFTNTIVGGGVVNQVGSGQLILTSSNNSYAGGTHINGLGSIFVNNGAALGSGLITVGSGQTDISVLKLSGGITLNNQLAIFPRAFGVINNGVLNPADFLNLDGTNILAPPSPIVIPGGGNLLTLQSDGGDLILNGGITAGGAARDLVLQGTAYGEVLGPIALSGGNTTLIWKLGTGTWTLWGNNTPGQPTTVSNGTLLVQGSMDANFVMVAGGTLGGTGVFAGPVIVSAGAKLAPTAGSGAIGTMTINNSLTLSNGSTTVMQLNESAGTNDEIIGLTNVVYGGNLVLSNLSGTIKTNDAFVLFSSTAYAGTFASITPAAPASGLRWDTNTLAVDGTLRVALSGARPRINGATVAGGNKLIFSGTGGFANSQYVLITSTNVAAPLSTWTPVITNQFDGSGNFSFTNAVSGTGAHFFAISTH